MSRFCEVLIVKQCTVQFLTLPNYIFRQTEAKVEASEANEKRRGFKQEKETTFGSTTGCPSTGNAFGEGAVVDGRSFGVTIIATEINRMFSFFLYVEIYEAFTYIEVFSLAILILPLFLLPEL